MTDEPADTTAHESESVTIPHQSRYYRERVREDAPNEILAKTIQHYDAVVDASHMASHGPGEKDYPPTHSVFVELYHGIGDDLNSLVENGTIDILGVNVVAPQEGGSTVIEVVPVRHEYEDIEMRRRTLERALEKDD